MTYGHALNRFNVTEASWAVLAAEGWTHIGTVERCGSCGGGTVIRDPDGVPKHRRCYAMDNGIEFEK